MNIIRYQPKDFNELFLTVDSR